MRRLQRGHRQDDLVQQDNRAAQLRARVLYRPGYVPNPIKNYVKETQADVSKAERLLGFRAKVGLEEGIRRTVEYYRQA
jgi:nucleoside-diphosphate-sugar epimerase